jgi:hypothetical protein
VVAEGIAEAIHLLARPGCLARMIREDDLGRETRYYYVTGPLGIEHLCLGSAVHRLIAFHGRELSHRLFAFAGLPLEIGDNATSAADSQLMMNRKSLNAAYRASASDGVERVELEPLLADFVAAAQSWERCIDAFVLYRPSEDIIDGGEVTWLDSPNHGIWRIPGMPAPGESAEFEEAALESIASQQASDSSAEVAVERTTSRAIIDEILSYLPVEIRE